jgi:catechol 2,3-dioxygenase-like lactoylglutathione lyase family enzyme
MSRTAITSNVTPSAVTPGWRFDHVNVSMADSRALSSLFEGVMGLQSGYRPPFPFPGLWLYAGDQALVHAVDDAALAVESSAVSFGHIAFRSEQPAVPLIEQLRRQGLVFRIARVPQENTAQIFVRLPGGFVVELDVPDDDALPVDHTYSANQA